MLVRNWKHQLLLLCLAKLWRGASNKIKTMNPQECVWEIRYRIIRKTILQEKVWILQHHNLVHKFILMPQAKKIQQQKQQWTRNGKKLEKFSAWNLTKVRSKKEVIDEARTAGATVHFASLMDICHLKNAELETKHQKYKGRVVLRGDIVEDDSGSYAVFTEQGSSASQMTAAKIMDIISRLPGCYGQVAHAVSTCTQVQMEDTHKLLQIPKSECPDIWIRLPRHKWPKIMVQYGRPSRSSWKEFVRSSNDRTFMREAIWENPIAVRLGKGFQLGIFSWKRVYSYLCMWMT